MADHKGASRKHGKSPQARQPKPEPGFERPASPEATNFEHPEPTGTFAPVPGAGAMPKPPRTESRATRAGRHVDPPSGPARPSGARSAKRATTSSSAPADPPLSVPSDSIGPQPVAPDVPELYDPNYSAATRPAGGPVHRDLGPDARVRDAMTADAEYCERDTALQIVARKMADRDVGAIPVVDNMDSMRPVGIVTDRDIVVRVIAKGQDPSSLRTDQVMSIDPATIEADALLGEAIPLMERRRIRRLMVVDGQGRLRGMLAQADIARATTRLEGGELLRRVSDPGPQETQGRYH